MGLVIPYQRSVERKLCLRRVTQATLDKLFTTTEAVVMCLRITIYLFICTNSTTLHSEKNCNQFTLLSVSRVEWKCAGQILMCTCLPTFWEKTELLNTEKTNHLEELDLLKLKNKVPLVFFDRARFFMPAFS